MRECEGRVSGPNYSKHLAAQFTSVASADRSKRSGFLQAVKHTEAPKGDRFVSEVGPARTKKTQELRSVYPTAAFSDAAFDGRLSVTIGGSRKGAIRKWPASTAHQIADSTAL